MTKVFEYDCAYCGVPCVRSSKGNFFGKFCSNSCQGKFRTEQAISEWLSGVRLGYSGKTKSLSPFVRRYLYELRGTACEICGWDEKHPNDNLPLTEIDHIDGDAENCVPENLRILCPNCHSMTPTFRARNKSSKRSRS